MLTLLLMLAQLCGSLIKQDCCPCPAGHYGDEEGVNEEELFDDADSGALLVLNRGDG